MAKVLPPLASLNHAMVWSLLATAYSVFVVWKETSLGEVGDFPAGLEAVLTLAIGLLLAFRINRAFERWWEGRILWGTLVNTCRNLAVKSRNLIGPNEALSERLEELIVAFPPTLRDHLRKGAKTPAIPGVEPPTWAVRHPPSWLVNHLYATLETLKRNEELRYGDFRVIDRDLRVLLDVCGGCERIRNTPIAASFRSLLIQALTLYLVTLPWGLVGDLGVTTIAVMFFTSYFVMAAEAIAEHVEQPFGDSGDALDLDGICRSIEASVREIFATPTAVDAPNAPPLRV